MSEKFKVVISGVSGRFPECDNIETLKDRLYNGGGDFVTVDDRKWRVGYRHKWNDEKVIPDATGKLSNVHEFDGIVFKMASGNTDNTDLQLRMVFEPSFEAIVDAGINPYSLDGGNVAVFFCTCLNDMDCFLFKSRNDSNISLVGLAKTMLANRVSFCLNLTGPSVTTFVDPHGGLQPLAAGFKHVSEGLCEAAIVGVTSNIFDPQISLQYCSFGLDVLSPDGITRPFDQWAKGYARSEAVVVFYLQRAEDAKRSYGELKLCESYYMGSMLSNFVRYEEEYLEATIRHLLEADDLLDGVLSDVAFVEMNAYGHKLMDKVEADVVAKLLSKKQSPLLVGSIKSRVGHAEAAAGLMAVLKSLFALDSGVVSPNDLVSKLNTTINAFKENRLQVVTEKTPLPGETVVVNNVGLFGTVGLAVIQQNRKESTISDEDNCPRLLLLCGREENGLRTKLTQIEELPYDRNFISLVNDAFSRDMPVHAYRGFTILPLPLKPMRDVEERGERNRPVWFIFTGMGSQWNGMGRSLLNLPLFSEIVAKCDRVLRTKNIDIYHILTSEDPTIFDNITNAFVGIITIQIGLCEIFKALGIEPDGMIGHSMGEIGCAYADDTLSLEQGLLASWSRGRVSLEVETVKGMMAAIGKGFAEVKDTLPEGVQVACHNSADNCTLSGPAEIVKNYVEELRNGGVFAKAVNVANIAYHSRLIAAMGPKLLNRLKDIIPEPKLRSSKWISTSAAEGTWDTASAQYSSAEYFTNNLLSPVLFEEACKHIPSNAICIEFAPHGLLQAVLKRSLPKTCTNIPLLSRLRTADSLEFLLSAIGKLYIAGLEPRVNNIFPKVEYPVPRGTHPTSTCCTWFHQNSSVPEKLKHQSRHDEPLSNEYNPICVRDGSEYAFLQDHRLHDRVIIPPSFFLHLVWRMYCYKRTEILGSSSVVFEDLRFNEHVPIRLQDTMYASVMIQYGSGNFQVLLHDGENSSDFRIIILTGSINPVCETAASCHQTKDECPQSQSGEKLMTGEQFSGIFERAGYCLGQEFDLFNSLYRHKSEEYSTSVTWTGNWVAFLDALMKVHLFAVADENVKGRVPVRLRKVTIMASQFQTLEKGTTLPCKVDATTNESFCSGVTMNDLKFEKSPSKSNSRLAKFRFVSYENPRCQNIREFLTLCLQIMIESSTGFGGGVSRLHISDCTDAHYSKIVENVVDESTLLDSIIVVNTTKVSQDENDLVWLITDNEESIAKLRSSNRKNTFVLFISSTKFNIGRDTDQYFVEVTKQTFFGKTLAFLKSRCSQNYGGECVQEEQKGDKAIPANFVVRRNIDLEDVNRLTTLTTTTTKNGSPETKYLYVMDTMAADDQKLVKLLHKQKDLNLPVCVLKDGEWGSYRNLDHQKDDRQDESDDDEYSTLLSNINESFPGVECTVCVYEENTFDDRKSERTYNFTYAAFVSETEKRIGFARTKSSGVPELDHTLSWTVPHTWCLEDAVTVPFIYAQAYRLLFSRYCPAYAKSIMINFGNEYLLAEALIVLSLYKEMDVFLLVNSDEEAVSIGNTFPQIPSTRILSCENCYPYEIRKQTKRRGVDLVINFLSGDRHVVASLDCIGIGGTYVEVGNKNCDFESSIGLYPFTFAITFHGVRNEVSDFFELSTAEKNAIQKFVNGAIEQGVIVPPKLDIVSKVPPNWRIMKCRPLRKIGNFSLPVMRYDSERSYMIVACATDHSWFDLIEWLVSRGARNFIVALEKYTSDPYMKYRLNRLLIGQKVKILFALTAELHDGSKAASLWDRVAKLGPLKAIFFLSVNTLGKEASTLDDVVSPDVHFIGLSSGGLKEFEHRRSKGSPAVLVHSSDKPTDLLSACPDFNNLLHENENNNAEILYKLVDSNATAKTRLIETWSNSSLKDYLPNDAATLDAIGQDDCEEFVFFETASLSRRYSQCKGVYPIFALPGIHRVMLEALFRRLIYPVFSADVAPTILLDEAARKLYQSLIKIQPYGPVTLISETWNLPLTLKLTSYLRNVDRKYKIVALEGNPKNWSQFVRAQNGRANYVDEIFNFVDGVKGKSTPTEFVSVEKKILAHAGKISSDSKFVRHVTKAARLIHDKIVAFAERPCVSELGLLENVVLLERHQPVDLEYRLSVTSEIVVINEPEYRGLLSNSEVIRIINENVEFSWWKYSGPVNA